LGNAAKIGFLHKLLSAPLTRFQTSGRYCIMHIMRSIWFMRFFVPFAQENIRES
jgi:hypothetical protein